MAFRNITNINSSKQQHHPGPLIAKTRKLKKEKSPTMDQKPQIRTSSPISSTTSDSFDAPPDGLFPTNPRHMSIRELAYEKLRQQKTAENLQRFSKQSETIKSNGKLKILAYNNYGHMTVHIIKGKNYKLPGDTYCRINMLPDVDQFYKSSQTSIARQSKRDTVLYDEKFSFELNQLCIHDRLCVSVWSKGSQGPYGNSVCSSSSSSTSSSSLSHPSSKDQLIGCFSFRIKSLMSSGSDSSEPQWYHLLSESIGTLKHFRCHRSKASRAGSSSSRLTEVNKDLIGMEKVIIQITRRSENESYGFTVSGNCPCTVGKVDATKQAYAYGLRPGDHISALKGINVSRATCDSVVKLIKSFKTGFVIEVYREKSRPVAVMDRKPENIYQEIPVVNVKQNGGGRAFLEVVHEEEEDDDSDDDYHEYEFPRFENIRHVDSDINTEEDERLDEHIFMIRQGSVKYLQSQARISSLRNLRIN